MVKLGMCKPLAQGYCMTDQGAHCAVSGLRSCARSKLGMAAWGATKLLKLC